MNCCVVMSVNFASVGDTLPSGEIKAAIVTVADAVHLEGQLGEHHEAEEQVAFADVVLLNKTDLIEGHSLGLIENRIRKINPYAKIIKTTESIPFKMKTTTNIKADYRKQNLILRLHKIVLKFL